MGKAVKVKKVKLFIGVIFKDLPLLAAIKKILTAKFGIIDLESHILEFDYTNYYEKELGANLKRKFFSFRNLISGDKISAIKVITNRLEKNFSKDGRRCLNLDPGYLNDAKIILATIKDYSHRIYLKDGIYAETTMVFSKTAFKPYPWTYPDYQSKEYIEIFNQIRSIFMQQRKNV
ncbi:MAG: DUF4416 family protein [Candidatus Omnitrophota bacterium]|nr:DUF4416 family protein [Candidatus Omnitrophota bacterium]